MKQISKFLKYTLLSIFFTTLHADGPGTTAFFSPNLQNGILGLQTTCYNSTNNQFLLTWLSLASQANCAIYDINGNQIGSQNILGSSGSAIFSCYNSKQNQYFVTWVGNPFFAILDDTGNIIIGPNNIPGPAGFALQADTICCYNSVDNQYCVAWSALKISDNSTHTFFIIINADGTISKGATEIPSPVGQTTGTGTDVYVTYNPKNNEYLFTWVGTASPLSSIGSTTFAVYDATGNAVIPAKTIPQIADFATNSTIFSCYNNTTNQYFMSWGSIGLDSLIHGFFAIYDNAGNVVVPATSIATTANIYSPLVCSYNGRNNQYFVSWNDSNTQALYSIFDSIGNVVSAGIIPPLRMHVPASIVFNSFSTQSDEYFITWFTGSTCAYYNIFTSTPAPIVVDTFNATPSIISKGNSSILTATFHGGFQPFTATWSDGTVVTNINALTASHTVSPTLTTNYSVTITDNYGETATSSDVKVTVTKPIVVNKFSATATIIKPGQSSTLTANFSGGLAPYTATWSDGTVVKNITKSPITHTVSPTKTTNYFVTITDSYGDSTTSNNITVKVNTCTTLIDTFIAALRAKYA